MRPFYRGVIPNVETMTDGSQFIDIILFAMVAVFLGLRLRSVLGRRTGKENPPDPSFRSGPSPVKAPGEDKVIELRPQAAARPEDVGAPTSVAAGLAQIGIADPSFSEEVFTNGAVAAFTMIVRGFAQGDEATLRPLLSDQVFADFSQAIRARKDAGQTCLNELVTVENADIAEARMEDRTAKVTVRFTSDQKIATADAEGKVVEGDPEHPVSITDLWTFARDVRSPNPNWLLVATNSREE
jgi:predicted lipid-binding transport protein (Tim44 family)